MAKQWDDVKSIIINYYSNRTLKEVMQIMHEQHDFKASQRSYRQKFKDWGIRKYRSHDPDWSSPSSNSSGYPPAQSNEHPVQHQSWVPRQQHQQHQHQQDKWTQSSSQHPLVALRTPEPDWGGNGVVLGRETGHARNGSNVTHVSATSGQYSMGSWSRVDGQYPVVSMSSPMSLPAPASPLSQPYSPLPAHPETYPLFSHHYNPPQHPPVTQTSSQHVVPSMATPLRQLNRGVVPDQPRHEWTQQRPSQSDLHGRRETAPEHMYPEDKLDHDVSDWARYRFTSRKDGP